LEGTDGRPGITAQEGQVTSFGMAEHDSAYYCLGIPTAKRGTRVEALKRVRHAMQEQSGGCGEAAAAGVQLRTDQGSQMMSAGFQAEIRYLGMECPPAFLRAPGGNGCSEPVSRTLHEWLLPGCHFAATWEPAEAPLEGWQCYKMSLWLIERYHFRSSQQLHEALIALEPAA
jgi:transposase InsO family protein